MSIYIGADYLLLMEMCESDIYLRTGKNETKVMDEVARLVINENNITCFDILGTPKEFKNAKIIEANLVGHRILIERV